MVIITRNKWINASVKYFSDLGIMEVYKMHKSTVIGQGGGKRGQSKQSKEVRERYQQQSAIRAGTRIRELVLANDLRYLWTLTYGEPVTDRQQVAQDFKKFIKRLNYALGDKVKYVAVMEIQEKRAKRSGKNVLHLHMAVNRYIDKVEVFELAWGHGYTFVSEHSEQILKVASYMAKYVKKGFNDPRVRAGEKKRYFCSQGLVRPERKAMYLTGEEIERVAVLADVAVEYDGARWYQIQNVNEKGKEFVEHYFKEETERSWRFLKYRHVAGRQFRTK